MKPNTDTYIAFCICRHQCRR